MTPARWPRWRRHSIIGWCSSSIHRTSTASPTRWCGGPSTTSSQGRGEHGCTSPPHAPWRPEQRAATRCPSTNWPATTPTPARPVEMAPCATCEWPASGRSTTSPSMSPLHPVEDGHLCRHRTHAVTDDLQVGPARLLQDVSHGTGPVDTSDVVERVGGDVGAQVGRRPVVEEPDVVAVPEQVVDEVLLGRTEERVGGHRQPRRQDDRALGRPRSVLGGVVRQSHRAEDAGGGPVVDPSVALDEPVLTGVLRALRLDKRLAELLELDRGGQRLAVDLVDVADEPQQEPGLQPSRSTRSHAVDLHAVDHLGHTGHADLCLASADCATGLVRDHEAQRREVRPHVGAAVVVQRLDPFEPIPLLVCCIDEVHPVPHRPPVHPVRVRLEQDERALLDRQPTLRTGAEPAQDHMAAQPARGVRTHEETVEIGDLDLQAETDQRVLQATALVAEVRIQRTVSRDEAVESLAPGHPRRVLPARRPQAARTALV